MAELVFIALGSNLNDPLQQLTRACSELANSPGLQLLARSPWYTSHPIGPVQPNYINGVVKIACKLQPLALLDRLQAIENSHQRIRTERWGPRTLDLDILLFGEQNIKTERLTVPHPEMHKRNFVIKPLSDIAPELQLSDGAAVTSLALALGMDGLQQLPANEQKGHKV